MKCRVCGNEKNNKVFKVKEMQFGLFEEFDYFECGNCSCLQIKEIPEDIGKYYPDDYKPHESPSQTFKDKLLFYLWKYYFTKNSKIGKLLSKHPHVNPRVFGDVWYEYVESKNNKNLAILDVGCGNGEFLLNLKKIGYDNLFGIDLFINKDKLPKDLNISKKSLDEYNPDLKFDIITSNHSFEHMDEPAFNLKCFKNLLKDNGLLFIRIPVKSDYIWNKYGINWFQIDAPRHIILHTLTSLKILAEEVGLTILDVVFDSGPSQFTVSNKYIKNIPMVDQTHNFKDINKHSLKYYLDKTKELNKNNEGDQAIFILTKK